MDDITRALFDAALGVQEHAHAPYSNYRWMFGADLIWTDLCGGEY